MWFEEALEFILGISGSFITLPEHGCFFYIFI